MPADGLAFFISPLIEVLFKPIFFLIFFLKLINVFCCLILSSISLVEIDFFKILILFFLFSIIFVSIFANALKNLKVEFAWIVNSEDGLDEISPYEKTSVYQIKNNEITKFNIDPKKLDIKANNFKNLIGKDSQYNANKIEEIFKGEDNDFSISVCLNAAAGLIVSGKFKDFKEAYNSTRKHILSGKSFDHLKKMRNV